MPATTAREEEVARLLDVSPAELSARAVELFQRESGKRYPAPLVLCGAGQLGKLTLRGLRRAGVDVVGLADNNRTLHGQKIDGCAVKSIDDAVRQYGRDAVFVTTIYTARPLHEQLSALGARVVSTRAVFFQHAEVFLPYLSIDQPASLVGQAEDIVDGVGQFADDASRAEYVAQIAWHTLASTTVPPWTPATETYFPEELIHLSDHEVFVDCGAFDGDTLREFIRRQGDRFDGFIAFEGKSLSRFQL